MPDRDRGRMALGLAVQNEDQTGDRTSGNWVCRIYGQYHSGNGQHLPAVCQRVCQCAGSRDECGLGIDPGDDCLSRHSGSGSGSGAGAGHWKSFAEGAQKRFKIRERIKDREKEPIDIIKKNRILKRDPSDDS